MNSIKPKEQKAISQAQGYIQQNNPKYARDTLLEYSKNNKLSQLGLYWLAISHGISGDATHAKNIAVKLAKENPGNIEYTKLLGNCCHDLKQFDEAINCFKKAIQRNERDYQSMANLASSLKEAKQLDEAETFFRRSLEIKPNQPDALSNYGLLLQSKGEIDSAIDLHKKALDLSPNKPVALYNLANVTKEKGDKELSLKLYNKVLFSTPNHLRALCDAAMLYTDMQKPETAEELLSRALALSPEDENVHLGFYYLNKTLEKTPEAIACLKEAIRINPENTTTKYLLAIAEGDKSFSSSPDNYVQALFDTYAETFDNHLVNNLQYRTPELINSTLRSKIDTAKKYNILDLGCGTGLAGVYLKDISNNMVGVDLSPKMVKKADERNIYNKLLVAGIEQYLSESSFHPDITVSADVFVYIGDLDKIFSLLSGKINTAGYFVFSTENTDDTDSFMLRESGRFAHSQKYIEHLANAHQFKLIETHNTILRYEAGKPMHGHVYLLQKS